MIAEKRFLDYSVSTATTTYKVLLQVVHLSMWLTGNWRHLQIDLNVLMQCASQILRVHRSYCSPSACFAYSTDTAVAR